MVRYLIDSNIIVNYTSEKFPEKAMRFLADVIDEIPNISVITKIETRSWRKMTRSKSISCSGFCNF